MEGQRMTSDQFRDIIGALGLSQLRASKLFGVDARTGRRWALGERSVPTTVAMLLRLVLSGKITVQDIRESGAFDLLSAPD
jgi:DNA-binding transcriptional regulator YdaS (Cro superfamily)